MIFRHGLHVLIERPATISDVFLIALVLVWLFSIIIVGLVGIGVESNCKKWIDEVVKFGKRLSR